MTLSLKPSHVRRYAEIGKLLWKYSRSDIFQTSAFADANGELPVTSDGPRPEQLADEEVGHALWFRGKDTHSRDLRNGRIRRRGMS